MNTVELFEFPDFKGDSCVIDQDTADLSCKGFRKKALSAKIVGDPWIIFSEIHYKGDFRCFKEGNHNSIPAFGEKISSARRVNGGLYKPKITLYEHINYGGRSLPLEKAANSLKHYDFDNIISSHKEVRGAWILYSDEYYKGNQMVTVAGDEIKDYRTLGWNDKVSSLKPVQAYES